MILKLCLGKLLNEFKHAVKAGLVTMPVYRLLNDLTPGLGKNILKQAQLSK